MKAIYFILAVLLVTGCTKTDIAPAQAKSTTSTTQTTTAVKADTVKSVTYSADTDTSNPNYIYNGTTGPGLIQVTCKDCTALATIGTVTIPFIFNTDGVGKLKYTPASGLLIQIAICPNNTKSVKADISDGSTSVYSYSGIITSNWSGTYISK